MTDLLVPPSPADPASLEPLVVTYADGECDVLVIRHDPALPIGGIEAIALERARQVHVHRYTPEWDDVHHADGAFVRMAADLLADLRGDRHRCRQTLAVIGSFIAAEIDRLTRQEARQ